MSLRPARHETLDDVSLAAIATLATAAMRMKIPFQRHREVLDHLIAIRQPDADVDRIAEEYVRALESLKGLGDLADPDCSDLIAYGPRLKQARRTSVSTEDGASALDDFASQTTQVSFTTLNDQGRHHHP